MKRTTMVYILLIGTTLITACTKKSTTTPVQPVLQDTLFMNVQNTISGDSTKVFVNLSQVYGQPNPVNYSGQFVATYGVELEVRGQLPVTAHSGYFEVVNLKTGDTLYGLNSLTPGQLYDYVWNADSATNFKFVAASN